ncbi:MAG: uroporphyrinogen decarboxylase family protein [Candidatus Thorarchaeota archaeon]
MEPLERVGTTLQHKEPDKVPIFLLMTIQGAEIANVSLQEYFDTPEIVAKSQMKLREKFDHDCYYPFFYAAKEYETFGGTALYKSFGPPESGVPLFKKPEDLISSEIPNGQATPLQPIIETQKNLFKEDGNRIPIFNAIMAPFSLPVMLFGFEKWIDTIVMEPDLARQVVEVLLPFSIDYSNVLLENGATALAYFNPVAAPHIVSRKQYHNLTLRADMEYYKSVKGPAVYAVAGGKCEQMLPDLVERVGVPGVIVSSRDDLSMIKSEYGNKTNLIGNLDNIAMTHWTKEEADQSVKKCIDDAAVGGGFIIADHHGDLPLEVQDDILLELVNSRDRWGQYSR